MGGMRICLLCRRGGTDKPYVAVLILDGLDLGILVSEQIGLPRCQHCFVANPASLQLASNPISSIISWQVAEEDQGDAQNK